VTTYLVEGSVIPERAQVSVQIPPFGITHFVTGYNATATVRIILNHVLVWIDTDESWDVYDLRNMVLAMLQYELALVGFVKGFAYDVDVRRVVNRDLGVDQVFGIDVPVIAERNSDVDVSAAVEMIRRHTAGHEGVLLHRCFNDLRQALRNADDSGFYCYRAIESLRHHCAIRYGIAARNKTAQWEKLREVTQAAEATLRIVKTFADPVRHGALGTITDSERAEVLKTTWDLVDAYLSTLGSDSEPDA
jgi:hypothetical protein